MEGEVAELLSTVGISLDIIGVAIIFFFGPAPRVRRGGGLFLLVGRDEEADRKSRRNDRCSRYAMGMILSGFALQLMALWV